MEVDKQLKFKSPKRMQVEFISNNVDEMTHDCLSRVAQCSGATQYINALHQITPTKCSGNAVQREFVCYIFASITNLSQTEIHITKN